MAIRKIFSITNDETFLRKKARPVEIFDKRLADLLDDMVSTMKKADGVGLAAPQVGMLKSVAVVCIDFENIYEFVNPKIVSQSGETFEEEGCLSVPNIRAEVCRPAKILVEYFDRKGRKKSLAAEDYLARAICHEVDHLNGILFIDKAKIKL